MTILTTALAAFMLLAHAPAAAQDPAVPEKEELKEFYDRAFTFYVDGHYAKAIEQWNLVLDKDPKQATARNMIEEARKKMSRTSTNVKKSFETLLARGRYADALVKLEELLATDPTSPAYQKAQARLVKIAAISPARGNSRAWAAAAEGISSWLGEAQDFQFAYDALRYAGELAQRDKSFPALVGALEEEFPRLKLDDTKPANTSVLEHKKELALHQIYDSKFYLAVKELEGVLRLEPDDIVALKRVGSAYLQLKDYRRARTAWQQALKISPQDEQLPQYLEALEKLASEQPKE